MSTTPATNASMLRRKVLGLLVLAVVGTIAPLGTAPEASAQQSSAVRLHINYCRFQGDGDQAFVGSKASPAPSPWTHWMTISEDPVSKDWTSKDWTLKFYWILQSGGRVTIDTKVGGWFELPFTHAEFQQKVADGEMARHQQGAACAKAAASAGQPVPKGALTASVFNRDTVSVNAYGTRSTKVGGGIVATIGHRMSWWNHELGHLLGLDHSTSNDLAKHGVWSGPGDYDDGWDVMSCCGFSSRSGGPHLNAFSLRRKGWLPANHVRTIDSTKLTAPVTVALGALDQLTPKLGVRNVQVTKPGSPYSYSVELRIKRGFDAEITADAALIHRIEGSPLKAGSRSVLLRGRGERNDLRQSVIDEEFGVQITVGAISPNNGGWVPVTVSPHSPTGGQMRTYEVGASGVKKGRTTTNGWTRVTNQPISAEQWTRGWSNARIFTVGSDTFLFLYKQESGQTHIHRMDPGSGKVGARVYTATNWDKGWNVTEFYQQAGSTFLLLFKGGIADEQAKGEVRVLQMNADGTPGARQTLPGTKKVNGTDRWMITDAHIADFSQVILSETAFGNLPMLVALSPRNGGRVRGYLIGNGGVPVLDPREVILELDGAHVSHHDMLVPLVLDSPTSPTGKRHLIGLHNSQNGSTRLWVGLGLTKQPLYWGKETWRSAQPSNVGGFSTARSFTVPGKGQHLFLYNRWSGSAEIWQLRTSDELHAAVQAGKTLAPRRARVQQSVWSHGWTSAEVFTTRTQSHLFLLKSGRWTNVEA